MGQLTTEGVQWSSPDGKVLVTSRVKSSAFAEDDEPEYTREIVVQDEEDLHQVEVVETTEDNYMDNIKEAILWAEGYHRGKYIEGDE